MLLCRNQVQIITHRCYACICIGGISKLILIMTLTSDSSPSLCTYQCQPHLPRSGRRGDLLMLDDKFPPQGTTLNYMSYKSPTNSYYLSWESLTIRPSMAIRVANSPTGPWGRVWVTNPHPLPDLG